MLNLPRTFHRAAVGAVALLALGGAIVALPAAQAADAGTTPAPHSEQLSDEFRTTVTARTVSTARVRRLPRRTSKAIDQLHFQTEDGFAEVYVVLRRYTDASGNAWLKIRLPGRPNGRTGWVQEGALGGLRTSHVHLRVNRAAATATLYVRGKKRWVFRVGTGKPSTPTPPGRFWIREKFVVRGGGGAFGPYAFGTADYSVLSEWPRGGVIGIHGTDEPGKIPGRPSHGCIRVRNGDIRRLWHRLPVGASLRVI